MILVCQCTLYSTLFGRAIQSVTWHFILFELSCRHISGPCSPKRLHSMCHRLWNIEWRFFQPQRLLPHDSPLVLLIIYIIASIRSNNCWRYTQILYIQLCICECVWCYYVQQPIYLLLHFHACFCIDANFLSLLNHDSLSINQLIKNFIELLGMKQIDYKASQ